MPFEMDGSQPPIAAISAGSKGIVFRNQATGQNAIWEMSGFSFTGFSGVTGAGTLFELGGVSDFNGDGWPDIVWRHKTNGQNWLWLMVGDTPVGFQPLPTVSDLAWRMAGAGDFTGDGLADVLWQNASNGTVAIWGMNGSQFLSSYVVGTVPVAWEVVGAGDFNGDSDLDVVFRNGVTGDNAAWLLSGTAFGSYCGLPSVGDTTWRIGGVGDLSGDGGPDLVWQKPSGLLGAWTMSGCQFGGYNGLPNVGDPDWQVEAIGDFVGGPVMPTLLTPANGATTANPTPAFTWTHVPGASQYEIWVDNAPPDWNPLVFPRDFTTALTYTPASPLPDGAYAWNVRAIFPDGAVGAWATPTGWRFSIAAQTGNQSPTASITTPVDGSSFVVGASVTFSGTGLDPEDGALSGSSLVWTSDLDGQIGQGSSFGTSALSVGTHTVTLTATDADGATGSDQVSLTVAVNQAPTVGIVAPADGSSYQSGASVALQGSATDPEDGVLAGASLVWSSDIDGQLGTGMSLTTISLSVGTHVITLMATDSRGLTGTGQITVSVTAAPSQVRIVSGDGQSAPGGQPLAQPLVVEVRAADGTPIPGVDVTFSASAGALSAATVATDAAGLAQTGLTLPLDPASNPIEVLVSVGATPFLYLNAYVQVPPPAGALLQFSTDFYSVSFTDENGDQASMWFPSSLSGDLNKRKLFGTGVSWLWDWNFGFPTLYNADRRKEAYVHAFRELAMQPLLANEWSGFLSNHFAQIGATAEEAAALIDVIQDGQVALNAPLPSNVVPIHPDLRDLALGATDKAVQSSELSGLHLAGVALKAIALQAEIGESIFAGVMLNALATDVAAQRLSDIRAALQAYGASDPVLWAALDQAMDDVTSARSATDAMVQAFWDNRADILVAGFDLGKAVLDPVFASRLANAIAPKLLPGVSPTFVAAAWIAAPLTTVKVLMFISENWKQGQDASALATLTYILANEETFSGVGVYREAAYGWYTTYKSLAQLMRELLPDWADWLNGGSDTEWEQYYEGGASQALALIPLPPQPSSALIAGTILDGGSPLQGVALNVTGKGTVITDANGRYSVAVPIGYTGTVTPSLSNCVVSPVSRSYSNLASSQLGQDFTADCAPDLEMVSISVSPSTPDAGSSFSMSFSMRNGGGQPSGAFQYQISGSGTNATPTEASLAPGESRTKNLVVTALPAGDYYLQVCLDPFDQIAEQDETNNCRRVDYTVVDPPTPLPNLDPRLVSGPSQAGIGDAVSISWRVENQGNAPAPAGWDTGIYLSSNSSITTSDHRIGTASFNSVLGVGQETIQQRTVNIPTNLQTGTYYIGVIADYTDVITESDEGDNDQRGNQIDILGAPALPDLVPTSGSAPSSASRGSNISVSVRTENQGSAGTSGGFRVKVYLSNDFTFGDSDDVEICSIVQTATLGAGAAVTTNLSCAIPSGISAGTYRLFSEVDTSNWINEDDEGNNYDLFDSIVIN